MDKRQNLDKFSQTITFRISLNYINRFYYFLYIFTNEVFLIPLMDKGNIVLNNFVKF